MSDVNRTSDENECALCHGAGRIGIPGATCDFCGGTGSRPEWLRLLAQARADAENEAVNGDADCTTGVTP
jgi:RecJ-like exonuclease